jgi:hypothetical protein
MPAPQTVWLIVNPNSGTADVASADRLAEAFGGAGMALVGTTLFPDTPLPSIAMLEAAGVDALAILSGDGTINTVATHLADWPGSLIPLPGGTMNLLPKLLHGDRDSAAIVAALGSARALRLPTVEAGGHRAFCRLIAGPLAAFAFAREAARHTDVARGWRALRYAIARSRTGAIQVTGVADIPPDARKAVVVYPEPARLAVAAVGLPSLLAATRIGLAFATGEFRDAADVATGTATALTVNGARTLHCLFDGEERTLAAPVAIRHAIAPNLFLATDPGCPDCST